MDNAQYECLGQVRGNSAFQLGREVGYGNAEDIRGESAFSYELPTATQAQTTCLENALQRLRTQAVALGADGVVGLVIRRDEPGRSKTGIETLVVGTAVRWRGPALPQSPQEPFLTTLDAQDFWKLIMAGYRPVNLAIGTSVYYCTPSPNTAGILHGRYVSEGCSPNRELPDFTRAVYHARRFAEQRMVQQASDARIEGIVGMNIQIQSKPMGSVNSALSGLYYFVQLVGTAITSCEHSEEDFKVSLAYPLVT